MCLESKLFYPREQRSKVLISKICSARSDCNNIAHGILSCYKLQDVFNQFTDKIQKLQLKYFSYQRDQRRAFSLTLICISKICYFVGKNSQNASVNRAKKSISVHSLYIKEVTDCLKPAGISPASIHQLIKNNANPCVCSIALVSKIICMILKIEQDLLLTVQTSFVYLLR